MSERLRPAHARPQPIASRVVAVVGAVGLAGLLLLLLAYCAGGGDEDRSGAAPATSVSPEAGRGSPPGSGAPPTGSRGPAGQTTQTPTVAGTSPSHSGPIPRGAPRTGGGAPGVRDPVLLTTGIVLLLAAGGLVLVRVWPADTWM
jgi:hypothetical protein